MKEVTEWDNNPRMMWVWDDDEEQRVEEFVIYIKDGNVITWDGEIHTTLIYEHCAEIEFE